MQHVSTSQICPHLPLEIWNKILEKTDAAACVILGRYDIVLSFRDLLFEKLRKNNCSNSELVNFARFRILSNMAALSGHINILEWERDIRSGMTSSYDMLFAVAGGNLSLIKWLHEKNCKVAPDTAHTRWYKTRTWLRKTKPQKSQDRSWTVRHWLLDLAVGLGHLDIVVWLHEVGFDEFRSGRAIVQAAESGHLHVLKWLHENRSERCTRDTTYCAAGNGHLEILKWLHENQLEDLSSETLLEAIRNGHLHVVKWIHDIRPEVFDIYHTVYVVAARHGRLHILKWLHENRSEGYFQDALDLAAENGHLKVVKFLYDNHLQNCTKSTIDGAAAKGHLDIARWLYERNPEKFTMQAHMWGLETVIVVY